MVISEKRADCDANMKVKGQRDRGTKRTLCFVINMATLEPGPITVNDVLLGYKSKWQIYHKYPYILVFFLKTPKAVGEDRQLLSYLVFQLDFA